MNSGMFVNENARLGSSHVEEIDPLAQVFARVHGKSPIGLSQKEIIQGTIEVVGETAWVDKNLAKMYLDAAARMDFIDELSDSLLEAARKICGINFKSIDELRTSLQYQ